MKRILTALVLVSINALAQKPAEPPKSYTLSEAETARYKQIDAQTAILQERHQILLELLQLEGTLAALATQKSSLDESVRKANHLDDSYVFDPNTLTYSPKPKP